MPASKRKPVAAIVSDTHCLPNAWVGRPGLRGDAFHAFETAVSVAIKKGLPIIACGDVIDVPNPASAVARFLRRQARRAKSAGLGFYFILGNHELTDPPWLAAISDVPVSLHKRTVEINGLKFYGLDYTPFDRLQQELAAVPEGTDVFICHQAWEEFMGKMCRTDGSLALIHNARFVITGDYHTYETKQIATVQGKSIRVLSPGSLVQTEITEVDPRCMHILYDDLTTEPIELKGRPQLAPPKLETEQHLEAFLENVDNQIAQAIADAEDLPEQLQKPIIRVEYSTTIPDVFRRLTKAIGDKAHFFRKEDRPATPEQDTDRKKKRNAVQAGLVGCLSEVVPDEKSDLYRLTRALLEEVQRGEKPEVVLQRLKTDFLQGAESGSSSTKQQLRKAAVPGVR